MVKRSNCRRLYYYEDDVVEYTQRGKVKIPEKYRYCTTKNKKHRYKGFLNKIEAEIALKYSLGCGDYYHFKAERYGYKIFRCKKCGLYHIRRNKNKIDYED